MRHFNYRNPIDLNEALQLARKNKEHLINDVINEVKKSNLKNIYMIYGESDHDESIIEAAKELQLNIKFISVKDENFKFTIEQDSIIIKDSDDTINFDDSLKNNSIVINRVLTKSGFECNMLSLRFLFDKLVELGFTVINKPLYNDVADNKFLTAKYLEDFGFSQPKYCVVNKCDVEKGDSNTLETKLKAIYKDPNQDTQYVVKILNGHGGNGVFICRDKNILSVLQSFFAIDSSISLLVQEKIEFDKGDIRVHVINIKGKQKILTSRLRTKSNPNDFRTNISLGNDVEDIELTDKQKEFVIDVAKKTNMGWVGIDMIHGNDDKDYIIELNAHPGITTTSTDKNEIKDWYLKLFSIFVELY